MLTLAAILAFAALVALVVFDEITTRASKALWLPVIWLSLAGSKMLSEWLGVSGSDPTGQEGSPFDRNFLTLILAIGAGILVSRRRRVAAVLRINWPIVLYVSYCALSICWSDFPDIAFKRWFKALGDLLMVLLIVTDTRPVAALRRVLTRTGFFLIPSSFVLIYFLHKGMTYSQWGEPTYTGVTTQKNTLGLDCLVFGLGFGWVLFRAWMDRRRRRGRAQAIIVNGSLLVMAIWLLLKSNSMTSLVCLLVGMGIIVLTNRFRFTRRPWLVHCLLVLIAGAAVGAVFLNVGLVEKLGRDPTLTGRTQVWHDVLELAPNPYIGAGFESFWLGKRLEIMWSRHAFHPNEAHNGYLEVFLNLGWCGVALLALLMWSGYRNVLKQLRRDPEIGSLAMAYFFMGTIYCMTEAGFRMMGPVWVLFLWAVTATPAAATKVARRVPRKVVVEENPYLLVSSEASR